MVVRLTGATTLSELILGQLGTREVAPNISWTVLARLHSPFIVAHLLEPSFREPSMRVFPRPTFINAYWQEARINFTYTPYDIVLNMMEGKSIHQSGAKSTIKSVHCPGPRVDVGGPWNYVMKSFFHLQPLVVINLIPHHQNRFFRSGAISW